MKDKFLRGIIGGLIAGIVKDLPAIIVGLFKEMTPMYWDYAGLIGFGKEPGTFLEHVHAIIIQLGFSVVVGVALVYISDRVQSKHYLLKGAFFGGLVWFAIRGVVFVFQIPKLSHPDAFVSILNSVTSLGYGMFLAWIDRYLQRKNRLPDP